MRLTSDSFQENALIPALYTCKGQGMSPSLRIADIPAGAVSLALVMHDPDAPNGDFLHWTMWNINPGVASIEEGAPPTGARQGMNDFGKIGYGGPCPPSGTHRYIFELYALDTLLDIPDRATRKQLEAAMHEHVLTTAQLTGVCNA